MTTKEISKQMYYLIQFLFVVEMTDKTVCFDVNSRPLLTSVNRGRMCMDMAKSKCNSEQAIAALFTRCSSQMFLFKIEGGAKRVVIVLGKICRPVMFSVVLPFCSW